MSEPETVYQCPLCGTPHLSVEAMRYCARTDEADDRDARRR